MLDETTPQTEESVTAPAEGEEASAPKAAKKTATRKTAAKKTAATKKTAAKRTTKKAAAAAEAPVEAPVEAPSEAPAEVAADLPAEEAAPAPAKKAAAKRTRKAPAKNAAVEPADAAPAAAAAAAEPAAEPAAEATAGEEAAAPAKKTAARKTAAKKTAAKKTTTRTTKKAAATKAAVIDEDAPVDGATAAAPDAAPAEDESGTLPLFQAPQPAKKAAAKRTRKRAAAKAEPVVEAPAEEDEETAVVDGAAAAEAEAAAETVAEGTGEATDEATAEAATDETADDTTGEATEAQAEEGEESDGSSDEEGGTPTRRRRRRGGRRRRKSGDANGEAGSEESDSDADSGDTDADADTEASSASDGDSDDSDQGDAEQGGSSSSRRRRRRRRSGDSDAGNGDDPENTVTRVRSARSAEDQITAVTGSTRLEAKKQRRREGREAGRRRAPIVSEAEFLARREAVERVMVIRQRKDLTQIAVLEDKVLVEHYVARESQTSLIGNVYLGRVQNVLPSMEAAFIDIGKGRNAVLYAGEVNWSALGHKDGQPRKIESVLSPGQPVLVQVTKDPIGHKGARLTSQVSLAGRFLVYVPDGTTSGISRKLPDTERSRLKALLKEIVPDSAGVIVRTAAEGASEEELTRDVERLKARWEVIESKAKGNAPQLLYGEPDLTLKVVRDLFTEDFSKLVIEGEDAWDTVSAYVEHVAPDLAERVEKYAPADAASAQQGDVFSVYRIDEQIAKGLDRKVWLPSGGSLVIDRTEAMTVVDVNTGKFTGSGGNLEETVTKNNLEAAEEIVRQLRLRDIGGIIVVDFIDMVLESNRDLVVRRLVECLGRDRTRHQVAEVTSLGLVQMTRKRIGTGLLEAFSTDCEHCNGRGIVTHSHPVDPKSGGGDDEGRGRGRRGRGGRGRGDDQSSDKPTDKGGDKSEKSDKGNDRSGGNRGDGRGERNGRSVKADAPVTPPAPPSPKDVAAMARHEAESQADAQAEPPTQTSAEPKVEAPAQTPTATPAAETPTETPTEAPAASEPAAAPVEDAAPAAEAAAPRVVTRQRRGASRRTAITTSTPAVVVTETPAAPVAAAQETTEAEKPKVVTRTRGRAAARPAGPPAEESPSGDSEEGGVEHVPVKKKGTRKR